jgi:hypothetical protein
MAARPANKGGASMRRAGQLADTDDVGTFDDPQMRAAAVAADRGRDRAYRQGQGAAKRRVQETGQRRGHQPAQVHDDPELQSLYEQGFNEHLTSGRRQQRRTRARNAVQPAATQITTAAHDSAGIVLGMIAYALFLAYVKGGFSGVTKWLGAKFLNNEHTTSSGAGGQSPNQAPGASTNSASEAWVKAHPGQWPHPGQGASDFWNAWAQMWAQGHGIAMQGKP